MAQAVATLEHLRARIAQIEGARVQHRRAPSGVGAIDALIGGLPQPGLVTVHGELGGGCTALVAQVVAAQTARAAPVAWIDAERQIHPPGLAGFGVDLRYLLLVRPPAGHAVWAAEQVLRSGQFGVVTISGIGAVGRGGQRWARAVEQGSCTALVVPQGVGRDLPAAVRLRVDGEGITVVRDRRGGFGRRSALPEPPWAADPWQWHRVTRRLRGIASG